jgi:hypothetical protein
MLEFKKLMLEFAKFILEFDIVGDLSSKANCRLKETERRSSLNFLNLTTSPMAADVDRHKLSVEN